MSQVSREAPRLAERFASWSELSKKAKRLQATHLRDLFERDPKRAERFSLEACGLSLDFSKNHLDEASFHRLLKIAGEAQLSQAVEAMFRGEPINNTEQRSALHVALRSPNAESEQEREVHATLTRLTRFVESVHEGRWRGFSDGGITDIVNIGIGGSDLGPRMVCRALEPFQLGTIRPHFVANIDAADLSGKLAHLDPESTLFIVASKSFSTLETLENAKTARQWLLDAGCQEGEIARHFVAITAREDRAMAFGIGEENIFPMWDWVGGRYSLWSPIGLTIALALGTEQFKTLLAGAYAMDQHFRQAPLAENMPIILALLTFWYGQSWNVSSQVVLPYNTLLRHLPDFLQQLDMESLGKGVNRDGARLPYHSGLVLWGSEGSIGQHSFHQLLHQGSRLIPADFIINRHAQHRLDHQHRHLLAAALSQSQALMEGKTAEEARREMLDAGMDATEAERLAPHRAVPGNRPSNVVLMDQIEPRSLGALIALYEHKVYALSVLLDINAFDQWGVELGKQLSGPIHAALRGADEEDKLDPSTRRLIQMLRQDE